MILVDKTILSEIDKGNIVVEPFNIQNLGTNSIDLTLNPGMLVYKNAINGGAIDCRNKNETLPVVIPD